MTGLMYSRPEDHIAFLQSCLQQLEEDNSGPVAWNRFIPTSKPLPGISPTDRNGYYGSPRSQAGSSISQKCTSLMVIDMLHVNIWL
jgi:hypothetical protein